ncbi:hypothetical protein L5515_003358 [Caenorhabditis briggsae]|uniref:Uncharacterized protein n=1 Tax=Caenorhabditis briggsae TaxID=6238 RepID=A0AAE9EI66_CAEBR|nr:hypothetical protein L5515_003358 [Caenorhabditis briggsae]
MLGPGPEHKEILWDFLGKNDMDIMLKNQGDKKAAQTHWSATIKSRRLALTPSYLCAPSNLLTTQKTPKFQYYLMDDEDRKHIAFFQNFLTANEWEERCYGHMGTIGNFVKSVREIMNSDDEEQVEKRYYIRSVPFENEQRVFADEIYELLPLIPCRGLMNTARAAELQDIWKQHGAHVYTTISLAELDLIFEDFKLDKTKVTIVEDPAYTIGENLMFTWGTNLNIHDLKRQPIISVPQAVLFLAQSIVCGVNWKAVKDEKKQVVLDEMRKVMALGKTSYVEYRYMLSVSIGVRQKLADLYLGPKEDVIFQKQHAMGEVDMPEFRRVFKKYQIPGFYENHESLTVYAVRVLLPLAWIQSFWEEEKNVFPELSRFILDEILIYVPDNLKMEYRRNVGLMLGGAFEKRPLNQLKNSDSPTSKNTINVEAEVAEILANFALNAKKNGNSRNAGNGENGESQQSGEKRVCQSCMDIRHLYNSTRNEFVQLGEKIREIGPIEMGMKELAGSIQAFDREIERLRQLESELSTPRKPVPKKKIQEEIERWNCKNDGFVTNISFYDNNSQEFLRGNATLREQYENIMKMNENLEQQILTHERQSSQISSFSATIFELQAKEHDKEIARLEKSIEDLEMRSDEQKSILKKDFQKNGISVEAE